jgi:hypothetical protein
MEEDIHLRQVSPIPVKTSDRVEKRLKDAIDKASHRADYESAHDPALQHALSIVETFIKRKKRVCYGGTAMNAILPEHKRFYNSETDLPDYDFYTPDMENDIEELVRDLQAEGYEDVYHKVGIHEGTKKVLVNFVAVADVSAIEPDLFAVMYRRSVNKNGVHYTDPDTLRMMMYLELSRPRGMVDRWEKVFERLQLINQEFPIRGNCKGSGEKRQAHLKMLPIDLRQNILDYAIKQGRVLCNGNLGAIYEKGIRHGKARFEIRGGGPLLFTSPDPKLDALAIKNAISDEELRLYMHAERGEMVPLRIEIRKGDTPICMFIDETACHSYNPIPLKDGRMMNVASLEFLITLYLSIEIFTNHSKDYLGERIMCQIKKFIELAGENYRSTKSQFEPFSLNCQGHQTGYASLLKAKVERVKKEKEEQKKRTRKAKRKAAREAKKTRKA